MAVGADKRLTGPAEPLHVHWVADAVAGPAVPHAEATAGRPQEQMLLGVQVVGFEEVVVDVLRDDADLHAVDPHRFQLQHHERSENILEQGLVDAQRDLVAGDHAPGNEPGADQILGDVERHGRA
jgi:hypothetical protein